MTESTKNTLLQTTREWSAALLVVLGTSSMIVGVGSVWALYAAGVIMLITGVRLAIDCAKRPQYRRDEPTP